MLIELDTYAQGSGTGKGEVEEVIGCAERSAGLTRGRSGNNGLWLVCGRSQDPRL